MEQYPIQELSQDSFPINLREIADPPSKLWLRGSLPTPDTKLLTVIGSRALSRYGREACESLIEGLAGYPVSIVSGLALGADACAHRAAIRSGLHTIAIPGSGLEDDVIGPRTNFPLSREILEKGGALLSESEPNHTARPEDFPSRNRIMVGLADAVLMVEAGMQSGSLISAKYASDYNRQLLCIPHRIGEPHGYGAEVFLRLGATYVSRPEHILEALQISVADESEAHFQHLVLPPFEQAVFDSLVQAKSRDELIRIHGNMAPQLVLTALMSLQLKGVIREEFGRWKQSHT